MTAVERAASWRDVVDRVKNILLRPAREWDLIDAERPRVGGLEGVPAFGG